MSVLSTHLSPLSNPEEIKFRSELLTFNEKVIIFDWDDTIFCTEYLKRYKLNYKSLFNQEYSLDTHFPFLMDELKMLEAVINFI